MGIDIGTGGCKVTLIDTACNFVSDGYAEYITHRPKAGWAEQDAADWFPAFLKAFGAALEKGNAKAVQVVALSMDSSAHNIVLLDKNDNVLRRTIMWTDQRSTKEAAYLLENHKDEIFRIGYQVPSPTWTMPQLMWINNNEPEVLKKTCRAMFIKDYVRYLLTGSWTTDHIDAQGSLLFDNIGWKWSKRLCQIGGIPMDIFPPLVKPSDVVGKITKHASSVTGLREGTPVVNGASDTALEAYAVGAIDENCCVVKLATAGVVTVFSKVPKPNPYALTYSHVVEGLWYNGFATSSAAASLRWYRDAFCKTDKKLYEESGKDIYKILDEEAEIVPAGSEGLYFHPHLMGERSPYWDSKLRGSFVGISAHHDRGHFNRAVMEGVAFSINDNFTRVDNNKNIKEIRIVGGGGKSPLWRSILADVLNRPILKFELDDSSFGSALLAGVGTGILNDDPEAVEKRLILKDKVMPDPQTVSIYENNFKTYLEIHDALVNVYHKTL